MTIDPNPPAPQPDKEPDEVALKLGDAIRTARMCKGMTKRALAKATGLSESMVSMAENGLRTPTVGSLAKIAKATGFPFLAMAWWSMPAAEADEIPSELRVQLADWIVGMMRRLTVP